MQKIQYINRETGLLETEETPGGAFMHFMYTNPIGKLGLHGLFKRKFISSIGGKYMNNPSSKQKINPFVEKYKLDLNEFVVPEDGFSHFNAFFYRKIKAEKRPINEGIISPADGRVLAFQSLRDISKFFVKGTAFDLETFLNDKTLAEKYKEGSMLIVRLAPVDYHRFHFPADGTPSKTIQIKGDYYSVSPIALRKSLAIFLQNKREYCVLHTKTHGDIVLMDVGATMTGSIIQTYIENQPIKKGDEKGYFAFGGSTVVVLFEKDAITFSEDLIKNTTQGYETYLKMGETIGK